MDEKPSTSTTIPRPERRRERTQLWWLWLYWTLRCVPWFAWFAAATQTALHLTQKHVVQKPEPAPGEFYVFTRGLRPECSCDAYVVAVGVLIAWAAIWAIETKAHLRVAKMWSALKHRAGVE